MLLFRFVGCVYIYVLSIFPWIEGLKFSIVNEPRENQISAGHPCNYSLPQGIVNVRFVCNQYENVGRFVDQIRQHNPQITATMTTNLIYYRVKFPNGTLPMNWYNGRFKITILEFNDCHLTHLSTNMLDPSAFKHLAGLTITNLAHIELKLEHTVQLLTLSIQNAHLKKIETIWLESQRSRLLEFNFGYLPPDTTISDIFGGEQTPKYKELNTVRLRGYDSNITRWLHSDNFSKLPSLDMLHLIECNIERIHPQTFNAMDSKRLSILNLAGNKLKVVEFNWFARFLDTPVELTGFGKELILANNPLACDCAFYALRNYSVYVSGSSEASTSQMTSCIDLNDVPPCAELQTISSAKLLLTQSRVKIFAYPKVNIRIVNGMLTIETAFTAKLRVLIVRATTHMETKSKIKCPTSKMVRSSGAFACVLAPKPVNVFRFLQNSTPTIFFVILTHPQKLVWPMHIQTIRWTNAPDFNICAIVSGSILGGLFTGILLFCCCWHLRKCVKKNKEDKVSPTAGLEAQMIRRSRVDIDFLSNQYLSIVYHQDYTSITEDNLYEHVMHSDV